MLDFFDVHRPGDIASIQENVSGNGPSKKTAKSKKASSSDSTDKQSEGVVYKVVHKAQAYITD
jgi:DNA polymerase alpha-associated DNA helicase A